MLLFYGIILAKQSLMILISTYMLCFCVNCFEQKLIYRNYCGGERFNWIHLRTYLQCMCIYYVHVVVC